MPTTVSALIPCYQMADRVADAVRSVLAQEGDALEIVVVDDGSTDAPAAALRPFGDRVKFLRQENRGVAAARQQLIADLSEQFDDATLLQFRVLLATIELWDADRLGATTPEAWQTTEETLISLGLLKAPIDLSAAYTEAFLPE